MTVFKDVMPHDEPKGTLGQGEVFVNFMGGGGNSMSVTICAKWRNCFVLKMELLLFIGGRVGFIRGF